MSTNQDEQEIERPRAVLRDRMRRVPERVNNGSVQAARDYKDAYSRARKAIEKKSVKLTELQTLINAVS